MKLNKKYVFLITTIIIGIIIGIIFSNIISDNDKILVNNNITEYFNNIKNDIKIDYINNLINSIKENILTITLIIILGLSIIGPITNEIILLIKSMQIGFIIGNIINVYLYKGILLSIIYIFPHLIINILIILLMIYHSNNYSIKIIKNIILKQNINLNNIIKKYANISLICISGLIISSIIETFISPQIIKLFTFLIK